MLPGSVFSMTTGRARPHNVSDSKVVTEHIENTGSASGTGEMAREEAPRRRGDRALAILGDQHIVLTDEDVCYALRRLDTNVLIAWTEQKYSPQD